MFNVGDKVKVKIDGKVGVIINKISLDATNQYIVFHNENLINTYYEEQLIKNDTSSNKYITKEEFLKTYSQIKMQLNSSDSIFSLNSGKIKFIPFQFRPLSKLLKSEYPRLLIADEVGVGKTIETGLIIKEYEKREEIENIIIVCPKDLTYKWQKEMKYRFDENFSILNSQSFSYCIKEFKDDGQWPINNRKCIVNLEMIRNDKYIQELQQLEGFYFDMLVLDEAHHVINQDSNSHKVIEQLCDISRIAVFLSATPLQLGSYDLYSLLNLLVPEEYIDYDVFKNMAEPNQYINSAIRCIRNSEENWQLNALKNLKQVYTNQWALERFSKNPQLEYWLDRLENELEPLTTIEKVSCLNDLEQLHTFSGIINRTKRKDIGEFTIREPITVVTTFNEQERVFYDKVTSFKRKVLTLRYDERTANFVMSTIERQITSCIPAFLDLLENFTKRGILSLKQNIEDDVEDIDNNYFNLKNDALELLKLSKTLPKKDSKAEKLLQIINETINNTDTKKLLVFSYFKNTLRYLKDIISKSGIRVELITGDTQDGDRENYRKRFRADYTQKDAIDVLLCSEVGCEGLDYEFCNRMVNYDIPWNPMKIEQRIGRIDRFGQKSPKVQIFNFIIEDTVEERIYFRCYERLGVFNSTIGDLEGVLGNAIDELNRTAMDLSLSEDQQIKKRNKLIENAIRLSEEQRKFENNSKDLLLLDMIHNENKIEEEKEIQALMMRTVLENHLINNYPGIKIENKELDSIKIRINKDNKTKMYSDIKEYIRKNKINRNAKEIEELNSFLLSDKYLLSFNISFNHPLLKMALAKEYSFDETSILSLTAKTNVIDKGVYLFACLKWIEKGYRENENIVPILINIKTKKEVDLSTIDFERIILKSENMDNKYEVDQISLDNVIYSKHMAEKKRIDTVNTDIVNRKFATLKQYYQREIDKVDELIKKSTNQKIKIMRKAQKEKIQEIWKTKKEELEEKYESDILISVIARGVIEVIENE